VGGGAAVVAAAAVALLGAGDGADDTVALPPVRQIELTAAARTAGCELRTGDVLRMAGLPARPAGPPARPGVLDDPPTPDALAGSLRRGLIVIQYRRGLPEDAVTRLRVLQALVPRGTLVAPQRTPGPFAVEVAGWRRLLGCRELSSAAVDAIRLFRGRFIGLGPDRPA
jgi:hypothetical protein